MKVLLNFRKQFAPAVECGSKRQTVRAHRKDGRRPMVGDVAVCYTGLRTKLTRKLREAPIVSVRNVTINTRDHRITIDGVTLRDCDARAFAAADGFATMEALFAFFRDTYGGDTFDGVCIAWDVSCAEDR